MNFRVDRRGHVGPPRTALTSRAKQAGKQAGWLPRGQAEAHGAASAWAVGMPAAAAAAAVAGEGGKRTVDPGRRGGKKVRASPSETERASARGSGTAQRAEPRRVCGNMAPRPSVRTTRQRRSETLTDARRSYQHSRAYGERRIGEGKNPVLPCWRR